MKKLMIKGMALLSLSMVFVACSHEGATYDEKAVVNADVAKRFASYEDAFVKHYGSIAPGHDWGFDQAKATTTRTAVTSTSESWIIPENFLFGEQNKEGINLGNLIKAETQNPGSNSNAVFTTDLDLDFSSFWLQHVEQPFGNAKNQIQELQAWNSKINDWETVDNFTKGKNNVDFDTNYYLYAELNKAAANTTLMTEMGGKAYENKNDADDPANGKRFRLKLSGNNNYSYDYYFLTYTHNPKFSLETGVYTETFLCMHVYTKQGGDTYWGIKIAHANKASELLKEAGVIFCEDLGQQNGSDFDFNDVVFNAKMYEDNHIDIEVLAAGGKLDIAIAGTHVDLGTKMANTGVNKGTVQKFTISAATASSLGITTLSKIPVVVTTKTNGDLTAEYALKATKGEIPQMVCAPIGTAWAEEYVSIEEAYPNFRQYVNSKEPNKWTTTFESLLVDLNLQTKP